MPSRPDTYADLGEGACFNDARVEIDKISLMPRSLFDDQEPPEASRPSPEEPKSAAPLAERMRPRTLDEVVGQEKVVGEGAFLRRAIAADRVPSLIFWGPPGTGKTTLARIIATVTSSHFVPFSAVTSGIKEVKEVMAEAVRLRKAQGRRTLLFVDEIHRFNRAQQDAFLPYVESGDVVLVGATTENPSFELNAALLSRCRVIVLEPLSPGGLAGMMRRALADPERGLGTSGVEADDEALAELAQLASGDARKALNLLELAAADAATRQRGSTPRPCAGSPQRKVLLYDKSGEEHYNLISALHKSLRESDPDAALYWFARMLASGEDPLYVARRIVRFASEDVGLADPQALTQTLAAWDAYNRLGSPGGGAGAGAGGALPRAGAQERRPLRRLQGRPPHRRGAPRRSGADGDPQRPHPPDEGGRLRRRLRLRAAHRRGGRRASTASPNPSRGRGSTSRRGRASRRS